MVITKSTIHDILIEEKVDWHLVQNYRKNYGNNKTVDFKKILHSINNVAANGSTLFSNIAFQGSNKSLVKAMLISKHQKLGIKDGIMFGKLTGIGTGSFRRKPNPSLNHRWIN